MHVISVKELREKFPVIRSELKKGKSFLIIYKSKPIAELKPLKNGNRFNVVEEMDEEIRMWEEAGVDDTNKYLESIGDKGLTEEEIKYYMSLPEPNDKRIR